MSIDLDGPWYAVRCVVRFPDSEGGPTVYEERITLWRADSFETAIARAEDELREYAAFHHGEEVELAQSFHLAVDGDVADGSEVFSLMRDSALPPREYVDQFFDTGAEHQGSTSSRRVDEISGKVEGRDEFSPRAES